LSGSSAASTGPTQFRSVGRHRNDQPSPGAADTVVVADIRDAARRRVLLWPFVVGAGYLVVSFAVLTAEYLSECSKLHRGFFTDTFSPFFYTNILSFPVSVVHSDWPGYPDQFDEHRALAMVRHALPSVAVNIVLEALLVTGLLLLLARSRRRVT
jgi:hypothetical protein